MALLASRDFVGYAALLAADYVNDDRRPTVNTGRSQGRDATIRMIEALIDVGFTHVEQTPIAIRGERLALFRRSWINPDSFNLDVLAACDLDSNDQFGFNIMFDPADLAGALWELDQLYAAGEGEINPTFVLESAKFWRLYNERSWDELQAWLGDDWRVIDHRLVSAGTMQSAREFIEYMRAMIDMTSELMAFETVHLLLGKQCGLSRMVARGISLEGVEFEMAFRLRDDPGLLNR